MIGFKDSFGSMSSRFLHRGLSVPGMRATIPRWENTSGRSSRDRIEALQDRLEELLILELHVDGGRRYLHLSSRALYKHVILSITAQKVDSERGTHQRHDSVFSGRPGLIPALGQLSVSQATPGNPDNSIREIEEQPSENLERDPCQVPSRKSISTNATSETVVEAKNADEEEVTYRERLGGYLHPRDMRRLVTPFSASNEPELIVRRHVMLLNFDPLRAIILRDCLLLIVPNGADEILEVLENRVRGGRKEMENAVFGDTAGGGIGESEHSHAPQANKSIDGDVPSVVHAQSSQQSSKNTATSILRIPPKIMKTVKGMGSKKNGGKAKDVHTAPTRADSSMSDIDEGSAEVQNKEWIELQKKDWIDLPFELQCVDGVLHSVCGILSNDSFDLQEEAYSAVLQLLETDSGLHDSAPEVLRTMKNKVQEMVSRVNGFVRAMNLVMDDSGDMALMNLSRVLSHPDRFIKPVPQQILDEESDEPELILEAHLQLALTLSNSLELIVGQLTNAQELLNQRLDSIRNRLLYVNMIISLLSLCVACASLVGSIFGMNLTNYLENDDEAFQQIVIGTLVGSFSLFFVMIFGLRMSGTLPSLFGDSRI